MKAFIGIDNKRADKASLTDDFKKDHLGDLNMNSQYIKNVPHPINAKDADANSLI